MKQTSPVPRVARFLLQRVAPDDARDDVTGDLEEMFHRQRDSRGLAAARLWYWRQVAAFVRRFTIERFRASRKHIDMSTGFSWMDFKLAVRMLIRYPGLTIIGVLGMAVGIMIAAGAFSILYTLVSPALPLPEGDRIVQIQNVDQERNSPERRVLHDFVAWRTEVRSLQDIGAFRHVGRNLIAPGVQPDTVRITEISPSGFRVARVAPLMGRPLLESDEQPGAAPVLVVGYEVWRRRFASDPAIVGRTVHLGEAPHTIVGVMPDGFAFPVADDLWVPFRAEVTKYERRKGPSLTVFGRLAPGETLESAQTELQTLGERAAAAYPQTHQRLRAQVLPYTFPYFDIDNPAMIWFVHLIQLMISLILVIVCVNVAILVYARTATRHAEIAVRSALGASRRRIVGQLFVEALVLTAVAAACGLLLTAVGLRQVNAAMQQIFGGLPFWWHFELSAGTVLYVGALTIVGAAIVGVMPALRATGARVQSGLQRISAGGGGGMQFGRTWTVLIVVQVGIAVALLPAAVYHAWASVQAGTADPGFPAKEFLTAQLVLDRPAPSTMPADAADAARREFAALYSDRQAEFERRVAAEPGVAGITFAMAPPGGELALVLEVEGAASPPDAIDYNIVEGVRHGHLVRFNRVPVGFFDVFDVHVLVGRDFSSSDTVAGSDRVIVNRTFAQRMFGSDNPLGRRVRYVGRSREAAPEDVVMGRWFEIVGVVADFPAQSMTSDKPVPKVYHAVARGQMTSVAVAIRSRGGDVTSFAGRLRQIGAEVDPHIQLRGITTLDSVLRSEQSMLRVIAAVLGVLTASVLLLSSAGIYSLMSFNVSQRRKEIGIRTALGADPRRILGSIFSRATAQLAIGAALGITVAALLEWATDGGLMSGNGLVVLPIVTVLMMTIGLLAVLGPARRGLRVHPTEALRQE